MGLFDALLVYLAVGVVICAITLHGLYDYCKERYLEPGEAVKLIFMVVFFWPPYLYFLIKHRE